jgi:hypothetical protein
MPNGPVDPASLEDDDLVRWYRRSPWQIDQERQALRRKQYNDFFGIQDGTSDSGNSPTSSTASQYGDDVGPQTPDTNPPLPIAPPSQDPSSGVASNGYVPGLLGDLRSLSAQTGDGQPTHGGWADQTFNPPEHANAFAGSISNDLYDDRLAGPDDGGAFSLVGNPAHPRLRREWSQKGGLPWPKDPVTGRNYDVAHIIAKADGGKDHVDNIRPMHPNDHYAEHMANGDPGRWGRRPGIARAFGGTVARSLGPLSIFSDILGMISGRIRTDNLDNLTSDVMGVPSLEDQQRSINPNWKRGDPILYEL